MFANLGQCQIDHRKLNQEVVYRNLSKILFIKIYLITFKIIKILGHKLMWFSHTNKIKTLFLKAKEVLEFYHATIHNIRVECLLINIQQSIVQQLDLVAFNIHQL